MTGPHEQHNGDNEPGSADAVQVEWLKGEGTDADVVVSSRVRLARNLAGMPFVNVASLDERANVLETCKQRIMSSDPDRSILQRIVWVDLHTVDEIDRQLLVERHLASQQHANGSRTRGKPDLRTPRAVAVGLPDERVSIMVNEEDHLRMQVIRSGLAFDEAFSEVSRIDDLLEQDLEFAFSQRFGYLTACPTNVGTGARFSAMLHLPALTIAGEIDKVKRAVTDMSLALRGFFGEGSEAIGDFYQISNQTTLGMSEQKLMNELAKQILPQVIRYERAARAKLLRGGTIRVADQAHRALGIAKHARLLTTEEAMKLLSRIRMGVVMGLIDNLPMQAVHRLMLQIHPAHLQRMVGKSINQDERQDARASLARARLHDAVAVDPDILQPGSDGPPSNDSGSA
ncbi:MAG: protein arginine kinase [Phycisphaeraceae bacterium]|nr:protein arginine kinase [Phycisphaerales bacterium]MCB9860709.1 protein arginine kinase [Phycisphaeraceae bacterium]